MASNIQAIFANFEELLKHLLSPDNAIRGQAEQAFAESKQFPDQLVLALVQFSRGSADITVRKMASILLRKVIVTSKDSLWPKLNPQTKNTVKNELLFAIENETDPSLRNRVCDALSELAASIVEEGGLEQWPELLHHMFRLVKSGNENHRESALEIFSQLIGYITEQMTPHFPVLQQVFTEGLNDPSLKVRLAALQAIVSFLRCVSEPAMRPPFQPLIPAMLEVLRGLLSQPDKHEETRAALESFVELAEEPNFLRPHIGMCFSAMMTIATSEQLEETIRHSAVEFLVTLAEHKPAMVRKIPNYIQSLIPVLFKMLTMIEDNPDWNLGEAHDAEDPDLEIAEECLDRLAISLGGKTLVPLLFSIIPTFLNSPEWKQRYAGLTAIAITGEGCLTALTPHLGEVVNSILPRFADPEPRVRWAVCNTVGQMSTDFGPDLQEEYHAQIIPSLIRVMDDFDNPRVQSHAASAIINFCEHASPENLLPYLDELMTKFIVLLTQGKIIVQEQAITAVAAVADCVEQHFLKYYDTFVPYLKSVLCQALTKEYKVLRGKALECVSLIGVAVGKEKFASDAKEVMELMMKSERMEANDPQISFMLQAWARFCKCLGQDFVPYLEYVMPPLLQSAGLQPDLKVTDETSPVPAEQEGWEFISVGDKNIGIHTAILDEKSTACNMIYCYADELKDGFYPYVDTVAKLLIPLLKFYYHDGVRTAAVSAMPCLLRSVAAYNEKHGNPDKSNLIGLWHHILPVMLEALPQEVGMDIVVGMLESMNECVEITGEGSLHPQQVEKIVQVLKLLLVDFFERRKERLDKVQDQDFDGEEGERIELENEKEEEMLTALLELSGQLVKTHKGVYLQVFKEILPFFTQMLHPQCRPNDRQISLCVFDDIVEFGGEAALPYYDHFVPAVVNYITDQNSAVRQAAVYGIGLCAQNGGEKFAPVVQESLVKLFNVVNDPASRGEENVHATENAISAIGKFCMFRSNIIDVAQVLPAWLSFLPVTEDKIESKIIYNLLCDFIENPKFNQIVFSNGYNSLLRILTVFSTIIGTDLIDEAIYRKMSGLLKAMQQSLPSDLLSQVFAALNDAQRAKLQQCASTQ